MPDPDFDTIQWERHEPILKEGGSDIMERAWRADIGRRWAERNPKSVEDTDRSFLTRYGKTKSWCVRDALRTVPPGSSWLEVGCAAGAHMRVLEAVGHGNPLGVDMNLEAMAEAPRGRVAQSRARHLPFADGSVDGIATSGTLIHLGPPDLMNACLKEFDRVARRWLFFVELWAKKPMVLIFGGNLLPPAYAYPWDKGVPNVLPHWTVRFSEVHINLKGNGADASSIIMLLMERT